jgi:hypothetical protein
LIVLVTQSESPSAGSGCCISSAELYGSPPALTLPLLLPGMHIDTSPTDYRPVKQMRPVRFNRRNWDLFSDLLAG